MLFAKSVLLGFLIAAPVGPIGMLCIQRSLSRGFRAGFATGIGAASADGIYGLLGAMGVAGIVTAVPLMSTVLRVGGGLFLIWLAWRIAREEPASPGARQHTPRTSITRDFLTTFALTMSNPMTILSFIGVFAALGPLSDPLGGQGWTTVSLMVSGVFVGSALWWISLSTVTATVRKVIPALWLRRFSRISATVVAVFGCLQVVSGIHDVLG